MVVFGIEAEEKRNFFLIDQFFRETNKRLKETSYLKNPFYGEIFLRDNIYFINLRPIWPNLWYIGVGWLFASWVVFGVGWWFIPGALLVASSVFWTKYFFYFMLKLGLKKKGFKGKMRLL